MTFRRTTTVLLAAAVLGAPAMASAKMATDPPPTHAAIVQAAALSRGGQAQDLRSPDARDAAVPAVHAQDLRSPDARDAAVERPGGGVPAPARSAWPHTAWLAPTPQPAAAPLPDDDMAWSTLAAGIGAALLLAGGLAFTAARTNRRRLGI